MLTREIWSPALLITMSSRPKPATVSVNESLASPVPRHRPESAAPCRRSPDVGGHLVGFAAAAPVVHRDLAPTRAEAARNGRTNAAAGAGDQARFSFEVY